VNNDPLRLVYFVLAWAAGILAAFWVDVPWWGWAIGIALAVGGAALAARTRRSGLVVAVCAAFLAAGGLRYVLAEPRITPSHVAYYNSGDYVTLDGVVIASPEPRERSTLLRIQAEQLTPEDGTAVTVHGRVMVQAVGVDAVRYGDPVRIVGRLEAPPEEEDFSYRDYLARQGVYSLIRFGSVEVTGERRGFFILQALSDFRTRAQEMIVRLLPDPEATLLSGILLGIEYGIDPQVREAFQVTGLTHVIAISGFNMTIIAGVLMGTLQPLIGFRRATLATIAGMALYAVFVGGDAAVWRAAVMGILAIIAMRTGREAYGPTALAVAGFALTAFNPQWLWDVGFQLSFFATLGLLLYVKPLENALRGRLERRMSAERANQVVALVSEPVIVTFSATLMTTPIMAYYFGQLSLISPLANLLALPVQPPIMLLGGLAVLLALVIYPVGQLLAWLAWVPLAWTIGVARTLGSIPGASLEVALSPGATWAVYGVLFGLTAFFYLSPEQREALWSKVHRRFGLKALATGGLLVGALLWMAWMRLPDGDLHVTFSEDVALITTPSGDHILVNGGASDRRLRTALGDALPFWERRVDALVITRTESSAIGALEGALERHHFGAALVGDFERTEALEDLLLEMEMAGTPIVLAQEGASIAIGDGVRMTVLEADGALALRVEYGQAQMLIAPGLSPADWPEAPAATIWEIDSFDEEGGGPQAVIFNYAQGETMVYPIGDGEMVSVSTDGERLWVWNH
jgi:competence protein ComEC